MSYNNTGNSKDKVVVPIDYTSRDFDSIRARLVEFIKVKYPDTYRDFNASSFGSLMVDLLSYVGDNLSFYIDYTANESNPTTAIEVDNVIEGFKALGYNHQVNRASVGEVQLYIPIPADSSGRPDSRYLDATILGGAKFRTAAGNVFTLMQDINLNQSDYTVHGYKYSSSDGSRATYWSLKVKADVISGQEDTHVVEVGTRRRFLKVEIPNSRVTEVIKVEDLDGNEYFEVDNLSQNTVLKPIVLPSHTSQGSPSILKATPAPRRFMVDTKASRTYIQFGYGSEQDIKSLDVSDPSTVALKITGKNYVSSNSFDPTKLVSTDKFGVAPTNTTLSITYRYNTSDNVNAAAGTVSEIISAEIVFNNESSLDQSKASFMRNNLEVYNDQPINGDVTFPTTQEIKQRAKSIFAAQSRAVTKQDYISSVYAMPSRFGAVKRCTILRDENDLRRNLNLYLIAEGASGTLEAPSTTLKENVKTWLNSVRMMSDSIDIFDAKIINLGIEYNVIPKAGVSLSALTGQIRTEMYEHFRDRLPDIGEYFYLSEIYSFLVNHKDVKHVNSVRVIAKSGTGYSDILYDIDNNMSPLGKYLYIPQDFIWEVKNPEDITWVEQSNFN